MLYRVQSTALGQSGLSLRILPGATITVRDKVAAIATIYADAVGVTPIDNPTTADSSGGYDFYVVPDDFYDVTVTANGKDVDERIYPLSSEQISAAITAAAAAAATATGASGAAAASAVLSQAWAESAGEPGTAGTKSSKTWAEDALEAAAQVELDRIQTSADKAAAEVARDEAEAARDAAQLSSGIYADTTAGLAATVSGGYFSTPSGDSDEYLILYLNSAGTAVDVETYPSAAVVQDLQDRVPPEFLARPLAPESGFVWAVTDEGGRPGVAMDLEGGLLARLRADANVPVSAMDNVETVTPESGYLWSIVDDNDRLSIGVKDDGSVYIAKLQAVIVGAVTLPTSTVTCYGDSMTAGAGGGGTTIATVIAAALPDRATNNRGTGGQNSAAIATRQGGLPMQCTVTSNQIPASGPVTLTARSQTPITNQGSASYTGTLAGVAGTLSASTGDGGATYTYTFTRTDAGSITACPAATPFIFDYDITDRADVLVIWSGRNDARTTRANVISTRYNILAMADHLTPEVKRFMVLPVFNGRAKDIADGVTAFEPSGSAAYINILAVNDELSRTFGSNFLSDARDYMVRFAIHDAGLTPTADDLSDITLDCVPRQLLADNVHGTADFYNQLGLYLARQITARGW